MPKRWCARTHARTHAQRDLHFTHMHVCVPSTIKSTAALFIAETSFAVASWCTIPVWWYAFKHDDTLSTCVHRIVELGGNRVYAVSVGLLPLALPQNLPFNNGSKINKSFTAYQTTVQWNAGLPAWTTSLVGLLGMLGLG